MQTDGANADRARDFGPQPLGELLERHDLTPRDLVDASTEQLTFKAVTRALKGRRLTPNMMGKVLRALRTATGAEYVLTDCFTYAGRDGRGPDGSRDS